MILDLGPNEARFLNVSSQKEFNKRQRDKEIGKKWIYLEKNTFHRQSVSHCRWQIWQPQNMPWLAFMGWVIL